MQWVNTATPSWIASRAHILVMRCLQLNPPRSSGRVPRKPDSSKSMAHQVGHSEVQLHIRVPFGGHSLLLPGSQWKSAKSGPAAIDSSLNFRTINERTRKGELREERRADTVICVCTQSVTYHQSCLVRMSGLGASLHHTERLPGRALNCFAVCFADASKAGMARSPLRVHT